MQEWLNWPLSKSGEPATVPRVRIPLSPPKYADDDSRQFILMVRGIATRLAIL